MTTTVGSITVYVSIGNSDDKLTQARWSEFWEVINWACRNRAGEVYGDWLSLPNSRWQNACIAFAITPAEAKKLKKELRDIAAVNGQDSIAWAEATTEFITPATAGPAPRSGLDKVQDAIRAARGGDAPVQAREFA